MTCGRHCDAGLALALAAPSSPPGPSPILSSIHSLTLSHACLIGPSPRSLNSPSPNAPETLSLIPSHRLLTHSTGDRMPRKFHTSPAAPLIPSQTRPARLPEPPLISKCRCGPLELPVLPTLPMACPS